MYIVVFLLIAVIAALYQIFFMGAPIVVAFLISLVVVNVGLLGLFSFYGHYFKGEMVAKKIGWPPNNPFQKEVAFFNLTLGVLGVLCIWLRGGFLTATVIANSVMMFACGIGHLLDLHKNKNKAPYNVGIVLWFDLLFPILLLGLLVLSLLGI
jgi:hypothetical protein